MAHIYLTSHSAENILVFRITLRNKSGALFYLSQLQGCCSRTSDCQVCIVNVLLLTNSDEHYESYASHITFCFILDSHTVPSSGLLNLQTIVTHPRQRTHFGTVVKHSELWNSECPTNTTGSQSMKRSTCRPQRYYQSILSVTVHLGWTQQSSQCARLLGSRHGAGLP